MRRCSGRVLVCVAVRVLQVVALVALVIQLILSTPVCAGILEDAEETLAELAGRAQRIRESLSQSIQREDETASFLRARQLELEDEQRKLQELADSARSIESEIDALKHSLVLQEDEARLLASSLDTTIESIQMQLRYLQRHRRVEDFLPFFATESLVESAVTARSLDHVLRLTEQLANEYKVQLDRLQDKREELMRTMVELESKQAELREVRAKQETRIASLNSSIVAARAALERAKSETAGLEAMLIEIEERTAELQALVEEEEHRIAEAARLANEDWLGSFLWPVAGRVASGSLVPIGHDSIYPGIDIVVESSTTVVAAKSGQVSHSGWIDGYGATVVINHGSGYSTIYSHCRSLLVATGDFVIAGEPIAEANQSTGSGPSFHFEIRKDGKPVETLQYLCKQ